MEFSMYELSKLVFTDVKDMTDEQVLELGRLAKQCLSIAACVLQKAGYKNLASDVIKAKDDIGC